MLSKSFVHCWIVVDDVESTVGVEIIETDCFSASKGLYEFHFNVAKSHAINVAYQSLAPYINKLFPLFSI
ncbi:TPA: hypothetical protein DIC40_06465 [Patescibacteria group bacterium]|nr:hypothetical protein [Candidatus Gracilibacteria bacterium]